MSFQVNGHIGLINSWMNEAATLALTRSQQDLSFITKPDGSPVTHTDIEIAELLSHKINKHFPDHTVITEETPLPDSFDPIRPVWVVDPIDGTYNFISGNNDWSISLGLLVKGQPVLGAIWVPKQNKNVLAVDRNLFLNGKQIEPFSQSDSYLGDVATTYGALQFLNIPLPSTWHLGGSLAHNIVKVALGQSHLFFASSASLWDIAGAAAILKAAHLDITDLKLSPLEYTHYFEQKETGPIIAGQVEHVTSFLDKGYLK